jgi:hypothetical protein
MVWEFKREFSSKSLPAKLQAYALLMSGGIGIAMEKTFT